YAQGFKDGDLLIKGQWASAMDLPADSSAAPSETTLPDIPKPAVGSLSMPNDSEMERLYKDACLWEVGSARETVRRARHTLIGIGKPASQWMVDKKLAEMTSTLVERAFVEVLQETESGELVLVFLQSEDPKKREPALRLATLLRLKGASSSVLKMLQTDSAMRSRAIVAAGALQMKEAVPVLVAMADDAAPMTQLSIALALGKIGEPSKAVEWLSGQLSHPELPIREACANALTLLDEPGVFALREVAESTEVSLARLAIQTLGRAKQTAGLEWLVEKARHDDWGMRLTVLQAIRALDSEESSLRLELLIQQEKDWRVLRALQRGGEQK
ncbi:MAG: HEAT repeat domain-containing protein, partial [Fimbriimonadia bacterium]|nr:HEAT repeat domain-containing protein [Fimbriimonadia bacterium]